MPPLPNATTIVSVWILLKVFASGCTAMTGVEAVSNGVKAFREPTAPNAQRTLTIIIVILAVLLAGIAYLASVYGIGATNPTTNYESVLSMLLCAVSGKGIFYYVSIGSILLVLSLSANTAFADFPRLCRIVALDGFLPQSFSIAGRRLVYTEGILVLTFLTAGLMILFDGVTDRLIPLYAVGAFLAFTLSHAGMVLHWKRQGDGHWRNIAINGLGSIATGTTTIVILSAKFVEGAWVTVILIPMMLIVMNLVKRHYNEVAKETSSQAPVDFANLQAPLVLMPIAMWTKVSEKALRFAYTLSHEVTAIHITAEPETEQVFHKHWAQFAALPAKQALNLLLVVRTIFA